MSDYSVLVIAQELFGFSARLGDVVTARSTTAVWSQAEQSERFALVSVTCSPGQRHELVTPGEYYWDFEEEVFRFRYNDTIFQPETFVSITEAAPHLECSEQIADTLDPLWRDHEANVCNYLHPAHLVAPSEEGFAYVRRYFLRRFYPLLAVEGIREYLATILYRDYGDIIQVGHDLAEATRQAVLSADGVTEPDRQWIEWTWGGL